MAGRKMLFKWSARITGFFAIGFFDGFFITNGFPELIRGFDGKLMSLLTVLVFASMGYIFAWFQEKLGGIVMTFAGVVLGLYMFYNTGKNEYLVMLLFSLALIIPGILFWVAGSQTIEQDF